MLAIRFNLVKLKMRFQFKPSCGECEYKSPEDCSLQKILGEDYNIYLLTYDKLQALRMSTSPEAKELLGKLLRCDVFVLDEFATSVLISIPTLILKSVDKKGKVITDLRDALEPCRRDSEKVGNMVRSIFWDIIDEFLSQFENAEKSEVVSNSWIETYSDEEARFLFNDCWRFLMELTEAGVVTTQLELIIFFY